MNEQEVVIPSLYDRVIGSKLNKKFKKGMTFVFGSNSPACELSLIDLVKSIGVYIMSSGVMYSIIDSYNTSRYEQHHSIREAVTYSIVVFFADISHRYSGHHRPTMPLPPPPPPPPTTIYSSEPRQNQPNESGYTGFPTR